MQYRQEKDFLGTKHVSESAYWGIHTQRALENFSFSPYKISATLINAFALVKKAAAQANKDLGYLEEEKATAIIQSCEDIMQGKLVEQFPIDALQGGAGTSTNMNINEVIANRAGELLGKEKGDYSCIHPLEHVNLHQSTNDTYPTALKIAAISLLRKLSQTIAQLQSAMQQKEQEYAQILIIGKTEMQDAVPMTLGAQFASFAEAIARDRWRTFKCEERLRVVNMGGTAIGTGLTAPRDYIFLVIEKLRDLCGIGLSRAENPIEQTANTDVFVEVSAMIKANACNLMKIANDLRMLHFLGDISLPKLQVGSSIMPGKINPVMCEAVIQAAMKVIANDQLIAHTVAHSSFQINEFLPLLAFALLESLELLITIQAAFSQHITGIVANQEQALQRFEKSLTLVTAFVPSLGYEQASALLKEFEETDQENVKEFLIEKLGHQRVEDILSPYNLVSLGYK